MKQKFLRSEWGGRLFFDGAHQLGLVAGGQFQDPLREGAAVMTGSAGKTFSGPQSGIIVWDEPTLTAPLTHAIFPVLAATHQVNRVAALAPVVEEVLNAILKRCRHFTSDTIPLSSLYRHD